MITTLSQIDPRAGTLRFPKDTDMVENFWLYDTQGKLVRNTNHESSEQFLVHTFLKKNDSVLEFGGGIGTNSIQICKTLGTGGRHMVFEPQKQLADLIRSNGKYNGLNIRVFHGALSKKPLFVPPFDASKNKWIFVKTNGTRGVSVPIKTTLPFKPTAIVMDCEGAGAQILTEFPAILERLRFIYFENDGGRKVYHTMRDILIRCGLTQVVNTQQHKVRNLNTSKEAVDRLQALVDAQKKQIQTLKDAGTAASMRDVEKARQLETALANNEMQTKTIESLQETVKVTQDQVRDCRTTATKHAKEQEERHRKAVANSKESVEKMLREVRRTADDRLQKSSDGMRKAQEKVVECTTTSRRNAKDQEDRHRRALADAKRNFENQLEKARRRHIDAQDTLRRTKDNKLQETTDELRRTHDKVRRELQKQVDVYVKRSTLYHVPTNATVVGRSNHVVRRDADNTLSVGVQRSRWGKPRGEVATFSNAPAARQAADRLMLNVFALRKENNTYSIVPMRMTWYTRRYVTAQIRNGQVNNYKKPPNDHVAVYFRRTLLDESVYEQAGKGSPSELEFAMIPDGYRRLPNSSQYVKDYRYGYVPGSFAGELFNRGRGKSLDEVVLEAKRLGLRQVGYRRETHPHPMYRRTGFKVRHFNFWPRKDDNVHIIIKLR